MGGPSRDPGQQNDVRRTRRALELTQATLAEQVGVSRQTIIAIENGGYAPSVYLALALADALGTSVEALFRPGRPAAPESAHAGGVQQ